MWKFYFGDINTFSQEVEIFQSSSVPFYVTLAACIFWGLFLKWVSRESDNEKR